MPTRLLPLLIIILLAACAPAATPAAPTGGDVIAPTAQVDVVFTPQVESGPATAQVDVVSTPQVATPGTSATAQVDIVITPQVAATESGMDMPKNEQIVLQYDTSGGLAAPMGNPIPLMTIYADGFVLFTREGEATLGFNRQVWTGQISETELNELLTFVEQSGIADLTSAVDITTAMTNTITLPPNDLPMDYLRFQVNDELRVVTSYPTGTEELKPFAEVRTRLLAVEPANAQLYEPANLTLLASEIDILENLDEANRALYQPWPFPEIVLEYSTSPGQLVTPEQAQAIYQTMLTTGIYYTNGESGYTVALYAFPPRSVGLPNPITSGPR